jgi:hypothetical protein
MPSAQQASGGRAACWIPSPLIERQQVVFAIADGRDHVLAETAGLTAGSWYATPATHVGHELIAGMMILAGGGRGVPFDYGELERWTRVGYERGTRSRHGER